VFGKKVIQSQLLDYLHGQPRPAELATVLDPNRCGVDLDPSWLSRVVFVLEQRALRID
jgi:hypothetical protein